ncbi:MAG: hypothetical protein L7F78_22190, partial [Syntrophales bacterium LBB04]|nr:hypothetical protein [Syntrophales bacterium LBB04]
MKKTWAFIYVTIFLLTNLARAENYTVTGNMASTIRYELQHQVTPGDGIKQMSLSFVGPQTFQSPTHAQQ